MIAMTFNDTSSVLEARKAHNKKLASAADKTRATWFPLAILAVLLALPALQFVGNYNYLLHLVLFTACYVTMASGWNVLGGFAGYISLGHNVFFAIGGYFAGMIFARYGISTIVLAPLAGVVCAAAGFLLGQIMLKTRGPSFIISSLALVMIVRILLDHWKFVGGANGLALQANDLPVQWAKLPY